MIRGLLQRRQVRRVSHVSPRVRKKRAPIYYRTTTSKSISGYHSASASFSHSSMMDWYMRDLPDRLRARRHRSNGKNNCANIEHEELGGAGGGREREMGGSRKIVIGRATNATLISTARYCSLLLAIYCSLLLAVITLC